MVFRKDIQILRGISVVLVVLFHLQLALTKSGFLGVDVFFVISGFLMAVLYKEGQAREFLTRRARRLLPAYFITVLASLLAAVILTLPTELDQVIEQSIYASLFVSNIGFWLENSYFSNSSFTPLLHLWSLGVEIQFYVLIPLLSDLFNKSKMFFGLVLGVSAGLCFLVIGTSPKTSFFMMPLRLWEFLIGYGVAHYFTYNGNINSDRYRWLGALGLLVVLIIPLLRVDGEATNALAGHPGFFALVICFATGLVLACGIPSTVENSRISDFFARIGKYSYSIYLAHFPVIVYFYYQPFSGTQIEGGLGSDLLVVIAMIVVFSAILYFFFESKGRLYEKIHLFVPSSIVVVILASLLAMQVPHLKFDDDELKIFGAWKDRGSYRCGKIFRIFNPTQITCELTGLDEADHTFMLIGNSHADSIKLTAAAAAKAQNSKLYFFVPNNPLLSSFYDTNRIIKEAHDTGVTSIILHYNSAGFLRFPWNDFIVAAASNNIKVSVLMPVPIYDFHIPSKLWMAHQNGKQVVGMTKEQYLDYNKSLYDILHRLESNTSHNLSVYGLLDEICPKECLLVNDDGRPLYFDSNHLTLSGADILHPVIYQIFEDFKHDLR